MNDQLRTYEHQFNGQSITTLVYKGRPCWLARDVGQWLGYRSPSRFASKMSGEWADEFIEHEDYAVLRGTELRDFKDLLAAVTETVFAKRSLAKTTGLVILYESGVDLALLKTNKPKGKQLRRVLKTQVLPELRRDPCRLPTLQTMSPAADVAPAEITTAANQRGRWLQWLYQELQGNVIVNQRTLVNLAIQAAETATGCDLTPIRQTLGRLPAETVKLFLRDWCRTGGRIEMDDLYRTYRGWAWFEQLEALNEREFRRCMDDLGFGVFFEGDRCFYPVTHICK